MMGEIVKKKPRYILIKYKPKMKGNLKIKSNSKLNLKIAKYLKNKNYFRKVLKKYYR